MWVCTSLRRPTYVHASMFVTVCVYFARLHAYACICMVARVGMCAYVRAYVVVCACMCTCVRESVRACVRAHVCS